MKEPTLQAHSVLAWLLRDGRRIAEPNVFLEGLAAQGYEGTTRGQP
jgi:hypothetical protein